MSWGSSEFSSYDDDDEDNRKNGTLESRGPQIIAATVEYKVKEQTPQVIFRFSPKLCLFLERPQWQVDPSLWCIESISSFTRCQADIDTDRMWYARMREESNQRKLQLHTLTLAPYLPVSWCILDRCITIWCPSVIAFRIHCWLLMPRNSCHCFKLMPFQGVLRCSVASRNTYQT